MHTNHFLSYFFIFFWRWILAMSGDFFQLSNFNLDIRFLSDDIFCLPVQIHNIWYWIMCSLVIASLERGLICKYFSLLLLVSCLALHLHLRKSLLITIQYLLNTDPLENKNTKKHINFFNHPFQITELKLKEINRIIFFYR